MTYSGYEIIWQFFVYSFLGWLLETVSAAIKQKRFVNRGLVNAPLCVIYGLSAVIITVLGNELQGFWLFIGGMILTTLIEWIADHWIEKIYRERWWNYENIKGNLDGYVCLPMSILWGILCIFVMNWGNPFLAEVFRCMPEIIGKVVIWILSGVLIVDITASLCILSGRSRKIEQWKDIDSWHTGISSELGRKIYGWVDLRIQKAYPKFSFCFLHDMIYPFFFFKYSLISAI